MKKKAFLALLTAVFLGANMLAFGACDPKPAGNNGGDANNTPSDNNVPSDNLPSDDPEEQEPETGVPLALSHKSGVYSESFDLTVTPDVSSHTVYYTLDGSIPTTASAQLKSAIRIDDPSYTRSYPLTDAVRMPWGSYGTYFYAKNNGCTVVRLLEMDASGKEVARKTATYFVRSNGKAAFPLPVVSLTMPKETFESFYNDIDNESKERAELEYFDFTSGEHFALNTQIKVGGNWTKGYPYRTMNLNFNKDEKGDKNAPVTVDLFQGRAARDGSELTDFKRFRLHSGGNAQVTSWFADAFAQRVAAEVGTSSGEKLHAATTGYRPCEVYIDGEYWGLYAIREHYSDVYFEQNYGVDKDEVILLDRAHNIKAGDPAYADAKVYNTTFAFELAEDSDDKHGMQIATDFFNYLMNGLYDNRFASPAGYRELSEKVDLVGLADLVLLNFYVGNWDFMNNNLKMWRTENTDDKNPYADGKWRFCIHDLDFAFESQWGDLHIDRADGYILGNNYLDFYLGNAFSWNGASPVGQLSRELSCLLRAPMQNEQFHDLLRERAQVIQEIYTSARALAIYDAMESEVDTAMHRHIMRWGRSDYGYSDWQWWTGTNRYVMNARIYMYDELNFVGGGPVYPDGDYFYRQVEAAITRHKNSL